VSTYRLAAYAAGLTRSQGATVSAAEPEPGATGSARPRRAAAARV